MIVKPGYKTTELIFAVLVAVGSLTAALAGELQPRYAAIASAVSAAAYALSRSITKNGALSGPSAIVTTEPVTTTTTPPSRPV